MLKFKILFLYLVFLIIGCSQKGSYSSGTETDPQMVADIVNGKEAIEADIIPGGLANSVVLISDWTPNCTGVLTSPTIVITAAHCVYTGDHRDPDNFVKVGFRILNSKSENTKYISAEKVVVHPGYFSQWGWDLNKILKLKVDDLAVIQLKSPAPASVHPATLATSDLSNPSIDSVTAVGYGNNHFTWNDNSGFGVLRYTVFQRQNIQMTKGMILIKDSSTAICHGDSGGPIFAGSGQSRKNIVVGLNDFILPHPSSFFKKRRLSKDLRDQDIDEYSRAYPDDDICVGINGFVDVASHREWILKTAAELGAPIQ